MESVSLRRGSAPYPAGLDRYLADRAPATITALGNLDILAGKTLALFCSVKCPGKLILQTYDFTHTLRDAGTTLIGGFHSPMEKECLAVLLRGAQPVIVCPARSLEGMRIPAGWRQPLATGRLLLLSPFEQGPRRATVELAQARNRLVAAIADAIFVAYAEAGSKTESFALEVLSWGKPLFTLPGDENQTLIHRGAQPARSDFRLP